MKLGDPDAPKVFKLVGGPLDGTTIPTDHFTAWPSLIVIDIGGSNPKLMYKMAIGIIDEYHHAG
jgi:hypothetical protein